MMEPRFYEMALCQVAGGLVNLCRPTSEGMHHLVNEMRTMATMAAESGQDEISRDAEEAEAAARSCLSGGGRGRQESVKAIGQLGRSLLGGLCHEVASSDPRETAPRAGRAVLIVDENRLSSSVLGNAFRSRDFKVRTATNFEDALAALLVFHPGALVCEVLVGELEVELMGRVFRNLSRCKPGLLIVMSGVAGEGLQTKLRRAEPDIFVPKTAGSASIVDAVVTAWKDG